MKISKKIYKKYHKSKKALKSHIQKIKARKGIINVKGNTIIYGFAQKSKEINHK